MICTYIPTPSCKYILSTQCLFRPLPVPLPLFCIFPVNLFLYNLTLFFFVYVNSSGMIYEIICMFVCICDTEWATTQKTIRNDRRKYNRNCYMKKANMLSNILKCEIILQWNQIAYIYNETNLSHRISWAAVFLKGATNDI